MEQTLASKTPQVKADYKPQVCNKCLQIKKITTRSATARYSHIVTTQCQCAFDVEVRHRLNLDACLSSFPLPGYDRESMRQRLQDAGVLL